ncbi:hypothetical protein NXS98_15530 [Fontisphaera persica]|uniref:hypothetical protein n=1 Tax=Fontisphaera persica TaxID=2974023 RepID=UPI0024BF9874|nr:hypothetical protein [Fontisphaera persica]WCJ59109.1 hypothetical protein NXS98_15530 [Fontisphaera persica]
MDGKVANQRRGARWKTGVGLAVVAAGLWTHGMAWAATSAPAPARVVMVHHPAATRHLQPQPEIVQRMMEEGLRQWTGQPDMARAWHSLMPTQTVVGIKVYALPGRLSGTRPEVVAALARSLIQAGWTPQNLIVWDKSREALLRAGFSELSATLGVRVEAVSDRGYDAQQAYERPVLGNLVYGDLEFGRQEPGVGRRSHVARLITEQIQRHIVVTPLLNHNQVEITGHLYSLALGGVDNVQRFETSTAQLMEAVPEIVAMECFSDRLVFCVTDALIAQYEGQQRGLLHYSAVLNELWFSRDPVALDVLGRDRLQRLREAAKSAPRKIQNELFINAALLDLGVADLSRIHIQRLNLPVAP